MKFIRKGIMDLQLKNKTALVTGASVGIGRGIAKALAAEGVKLAISARRADKLQEVADEIVAAGGHRPVIIESDLYPEDAAAKLTAAAIQGLGHVDILVNNAWGGGGMGRIENKTNELLQHGLNMSMYAAFWAMRESFPIIESCLVRRDSSLARG